MRNESWLTASFLRADALTACCALQLETAPRRAVGDATVVDVSTPEGTNVTLELGVLEELQTVFNPKMASASYVAFNCLAGREKAQLTFYTAS